MDKLRIGVAGTGNISDIYLRNLTGVFSRAVTVTAVANRTREKAEKAAERYHIPHVYALDELINADTVDLVLNLTAPERHYTLAMAAVQARKHVYNEKPLCITREEATVLLKAAWENKARVGCAPDTFLGAGMQTCRKLLDDGWIGRPIAGAAFVMNHGMEAWHPSPEAFYKTGGGPLFDVGPYYLTALVNLLGPIARVSGSAQKGFTTRTVTSEPQAGTVITVDVPTHVAATLDFANNTVVTLITSFDVWSHSLPYIELYGTEGALRLPDPNMFRGVVQVRRYKAEAWSEIPLIMHHADDCKDAGEWSGSANLRGLGVVDMADAITNGVPHRASSDMAYHVLDVMHGIYEAASSGVYYHVKSTCERPAAFQDS
ncbi:MAG: Gfo/Idh/MocA family oxidoreductase [Treponema sp.]|jgi:predicted dehydrogenase|nr:Gfo/Idh/MocA family oxidoreductase [Treponema sp.]